MPRVFSGMQPTGSLHLGNYLGAMKNWVKLQRDFSSSVFCIVDLHAMTAPNKSSIYSCIINAAAHYIACGIDVEKSIIFLQSSIYEHTQLSWILGCLISTGRMNRMTQFKEKKVMKRQHSASLGLYSYPVLMAADILLYKATHVPVGDDQRQHIELCGDIVDIFNSFYSTSCFSSPRMLCSEFNSRVMSLKDGNVKMSKSDSSDDSRINLSDAPEAIKRKITRAKSDNILGFDIDTLQDRPEAQNLINMYCNLSEMSMESACNEIDSFSILKNRLSDVLIASLGRIHARFVELQQDTVYIRNILEKGRERAQKIASSNFDEIKNIIGMYS